ncbi:MAG: CapA family protein [Candidatus Kapabacteria bacterium]|nr:CapA family protein [Ignavibacteriota bacterium]MCW5883625.1 CapA family protein [Candidatus Kapabacteria bacterium]
MKFKYFFLSLFIISCIKNDKVQINADEIHDIVVIDSNIETDSLFTIIGVGDIMLGTNFPSEKHLPPKGLNLLKPMYDIIQSADVSFCNLEGAVADSGGKAKTCSDPKICYAFRQPEYLMKDLKGAGFDLISIANNHIFDFGYDIALNTAKVLDEYGFRFAGTDFKPWDTLTVKGRKIGFAAFAPNPGTISIINYDVARKIITHLDSISDIVIVSFHGGAEGKKALNVTRDYEEFYGDNRGNVYEFAHNVIDFGADVVFGHGPHVTRAIEIYKDRFIAYSLGNFCTYDRFNISGLSGIAPVIKLKVDSNGKFEEGEIISIKQIGRGEPIIDESKAALKELIRLTNEDFPENRIIFEDIIFRNKD